MFEKFKGILLSVLDNPLHSGFFLRTGLFFWFGGFLVWLFSIINWNTIDKLLNGVSLKDNEQLLVNSGFLLRRLARFELEKEIILAVLLLVCLVFLMGAIVNALQFPLLRLSEGYGWYDWLFDWKANHYRKQHQANLKRWKALLEKDEASLTPSEIREYDRVSSDVSLNLVMARVCRHG